MRRRPLLVACAVVLASREAHGEPYLPKTGEIVHLQSSTTGRTDGGTDLRLPPGYFLDESTFKEKDGELRTLQEAKTRLTAENESLRKSQSSWQPGWKTIATTFVIGLAGGFYIHSKI